MTKISEPNQENAQRMLTEITKLISPVINNQNQGDIYATLLSLNTGYLSILLKDCPKRLLDGVINKFTDEFKEALLFGIEQDKNHF